MGGGVVCTVIFMSNPTVVLCCVGVGVLTKELNFNEDQEGKQGVKDSTESQNSIIINNQDDLIVRLTRQSFGSV